MRSHRIGRAWCAAAGLAWTMTEAPHAQATAQAERVLASVDVLVTQKVVDTGGASPWPTQTRTAFTLQKVRTEAGVKIVLTYLPAAPAERSQATSHPLDGGRVEYDPSTGATAVFDVGGTRRNPHLSLEGSSQAGLGSANELFDNLVLRRAGTSARRQDLERRYGRPSGGAPRGLARYLQVRDDGLREEMLADPEWGVPVEVTLTRDARPEGRVAFEYGSTPSGNLYRRATRTERVIDAASGRRSVLAVQYSNVRVDGW